MNVKQEPEWRKSFVLCAYVHNSKLKNAAIRMVFQYWVTYIHGKKYPKSNVGNNSGNASISIYIPSTWKVEQFPIMGN